MRPLWEVLGIRLGLVSDSANLSLLQSQAVKNEKRKGLCVMCLVLEKSLGRRRQGERELLAESDVAQAIPGSEGVGLLRCAW